MPNTMRKIIAPQKPNISKIAIKHPRYMNANILNVFVISSIMPYIVYKSK